LTKMNDIQSFRAMDALKETQQRESGEEDDQFEEIRKANIEQLRQSDVPIKLFAKAQIDTKQLPTKLSDHEKVNNRSGPRKEPDASRDKKHSRRGRFNDRDDEMDTESTRPLQPTTLFDFMTSKVQLPSSSSSTVPLQSTNETRPSDQSRSHQNRAIDNYSHQNRTSIDNRRQHTTRTNHLNSPFMKPIVSPPSLSREDFPDMAQANNSIAVSNSRPKGQPSVSNSRPKSQPSVSNSRPKGHLSDLDNGNGTRSSQPSSLSTTRSQGNGDKKMEWRIGQRCQAPWSDGQFYPAIIARLGPGDECSIKFIDYPDTITVPRGVLLLL